MPEGEDGGAGNLVAGRDAGFDVVQVAQRRAEQTDEQRGERRDEGDS